MFALSVGAVVVLVTTFAAPLVTPVLAAAGAIASVVESRRHRNAWLWFPATVFVLALAVSLAIDVGLLATRTDLPQITPADPSG
jgi:small neutral amino acid transporter SnatA (MarC family)